MEGKKKFLPSNRMLSSIIITCSVSAGLTKYKDNKTAGNETLLL